VGNTKNDGHHEPESGEWQKKKGSKRGTVLGGGRWAKNSKGSFIANRNGGKKEPKRDLPAVREKWSHGKLRRLQKRLPKRTKVPKERNWIPQKPRGGGNRQVIGTGMLGVTRGKTTRQGGILKQRRKRGERIRVDKRTATKIS